MRFLGGGISHAAPLPHSQSLIPPTDDPQLETVGKPSKPQVTEELSTINDTDIRDADTELDDEQEDGFEHEQDALPPTSNVGNDGQNLDIADGKQELGGDEDPWNELVQYDY